MSEIGNLFRKMLFWTRRFLVSSWFTSIWNVTCIQWRDAKCVRCICLRKFYL